MKNQSILKQPEFKEKIMDIEDLFCAGVKYACCSYYAAISRITLAEIIFMPYNVSDKRELMKIWIEI